MYQHPAALDLNASYYQQQALHEAKMRRLAGEARPTDERYFGTTTFQRRVLAAAVALVTVLGMVALV